MTSVSLWMNEIANYGLCKVDMNSRDINSGSIYEQHGYADIASPKWHSKTRPTINVSYH